MKEIASHHHVCDILFFLKDCFVKKNTQGDQSATTTQACVRSAKLVQLVIFNILLIFAKEKTIYFQVFKSFSNPS